MTIDDVNSLISTNCVQCAFMSLQSLSGHTTPVDAVKFSRLEDMVIAGSLSGALKIWDLESVKSRQLLAVLFYNNVVHAVTRPVSPRAHSSAAVLPEFAIGCFCG